MRCNVHGKEIKMKLIHLSDLHIGKKINERSMLDEQKYILDQILEGVRAEKPDAVLISGDVYDKTTPPLEAVMLLDDFLNKLEIDGLTVLLISGNHDSPERLSFGAKRMKKSGLYIKSVFDGDLTPVTLSDEYGEVNFYLVPFIRISDVNRVYETDFRDYTMAFLHVVEKMGIDPSKRNILLSHQFVAGASFSESESAIGGIDSISTVAYEPFDYTALGHIHKPQYVVNERLRYCGTPLKYSASEIGFEKTYTVVELYEKPASDKLCRMSIRTVPLNPLHDMIKLTGSFDELMNMSRNENGYVTEDYVYAVLTDSDYINDPASHLRNLYPNLLSVSYKGNGRTATLYSPESEGEHNSKTPVDIFEEFYRKMHDGEEIDEDKKIILKAAIKEVWGEEGEQQ